MNGSASPLDTASVYPDDASLKIIAGMIPRAYEGRIFALDRETSDGSREELKRPATPDQVVAAARIMAAQKNPPGGSTLDRIGTATLDLLFSRPSRAIAVLEAEGIHEKSVRVENDLSVAYLLRYRQGANPQDLLASLSHAARAVSLCEDCPEALFNLALVSGKLGLRNQAARAATRTLEFERPGHWQQQALELALRSRDESFVRDWELAAEAARNGTLPEPHLLDSLIAGDPHRAWGLLSENLLSVWAKHEIRKDVARADATLASARVIADLIQRGSGDEFALDTVRVLASTPHRTKRAFLATGHRDLAAGMLEYRRQNFLDAERLLGQAEREFRAGRSVAEYEASFYRAVCVYYASVPTAERLFDALLNRVDVGRYPDLRGRTLWMLGTTQMARLRFEEAIASFSEMAAIEERSGGPTERGMASTLLAEAYELRGEGLRSWRYRLQGLVQLSLRGDYRRRHSALLETATALVRQGAPDLGQLFADELEQNAEKWPEPVALAETYVLRSQAELALGNWQKALSYARRAYGNALKMSAGSLRNRSLGSSLLAEGAALAQDDPTTALRALEDGRALQAPGEWDVERLPFLHYAAVADLALGASDRAHRRLDQAVSIYESIRSNATTPQARAEALRLAQPSFDDLIRLSLRDASSDAGMSALMYAERARSRSLFDAWSRSTVKNTTLGTPGAIELPRPGVTVVEYYVLSDEVISWVVNTDGLRVSRRSVKRSTLANLCKAFAGALEANDRAGARDTGAQLFDLLFRPLQLPKDAALIAVVPDGPLVGLPFAAVFDREKQRFLVEDFAVVSAPSLTLLALAQRQQSAMTADCKSGALVVGSPQLSGKAWGDLPDLPGALAEAQAVAELYPEHVLLTGPAATPRAISALLPSYAVLHFAGHAVAKNDDASSSVLLASPSSQSEAGELTVSEVPPACLKLAVLAACRSLAGQGDSREAPLNISTAFFGAGVPSVVAALWDVDDEATPRLMAAFHRHYRILRSAPRALRAAMLEEIHEHTEKESLGWAAFAAFGS